MDHLGSLIKELERVRRRQQRNETLAAKRAVREQQREIVASQRSTRAQQRDAELRVKYAQLAIYEDYVGALTDLHRDTEAEIQWDAVLRSPVPATPARPGRHEAGVRAAFEARQFGLIDKLFGRRRQAEREMEAVAKVARQHDDAEYATIMDAHHAVVERDGVLRSVAARWVNGPIPEEFEAVLVALKVFAPAGLFGGRAFVEEATHDYVKAWIALPPGDSPVIPSEEWSLTSTGKPTSRAMSASKKWDLYQDFVASVALRTAADMLATLPVQRVIINVGVDHLDTSTGHRGVVTYLALGVPRSTLMSINLSNVDPSDALKNFPHRMKFKKSTGFQPVEPMTSDETWVTR